MTTKADALRADLKAAGFKPKQVTVRQTAGCSLDVTIRDAAVSLTAVKAIADKHVRVRYCEASGEILSGGNTFVGVRYVDTVIDPVAKKIAAILRTSNGHAVQVTPSVSVSVDADGCDYNAKVWLHEGHTGAFFCHGVDHAAERLATRVLDAGQAHLISEGRKPVPVADHADPEWIANIAID